MENVEALTGLQLDPTLPQTTVQPQRPLLQGSPLGARSTVGGYPGLTGLPTMSGYPGAYNTGYPGVNTGAYQAPLTRGYPGAYQAPYTGGYPGVYGGYPGVSGGYPGVYGGYPGVSGGYQPGLRSSLLAQPRTTQPRVVDTTNVQDTVTARVEETLRRSRVIGEALQRSRVYGNQGQFPGLNSGYANLYGGTGYGYPRTALAPQMVAPQMVAPQMVHAPQMVAPQMTYSQVPQTFAPQVQQTYHQQPTVLQQSVQPVLQQALLQQPRTVLQQPFQQVVNQPLRRSLVGAPALSGTTAHFGHGSAYNGVYGGSFAGLGGQLGGYGGYPLNRGVQRQPVAQRLPATSYGQAPLYGTTPVDQGYREYVLRKSKELVEQQAQLDQDEE